MSFNRYRTVLSHPIISRVPLARFPRWNPIKELQTRGLQNRSRQPSKASPQRRSSPAPPQEQSQPILNETEFTSNPNEKYDEFEDEPELRDRKVKYLAPAIWALTVSAGFYITFAYFTAKNELEETVTFRLFEGNWVSTRKQSSSPYVNNGPPTPTEVVTRAWRDSDPMSKLSWGLIGVNGAVHLSSMFAHNVWSHLWHVPVTNRNYTLLTSIFVHSGLAHLAFNSYATYNFLPATGWSRLFRGDTYHMLAFFLSTGVVSSVAQHVATVVFKHGRAYSAFIPSGGASGALFAVFGAFCMEYPTQGVGIILIPYYIEAQYFLPAVMLFDFVGMVRGFPSMNLGHAAHLSGACIGAAYSYLDGHNNVWRPLVDFWKLRLKGKSVA